MSEAHRAEERPVPASGDGVGQRRLPAPPCRGPCRCAELSHVLRRVLEAVACGQIEAVSPQERRLVRRVESALAAFEAGWGVRGPNDVKPD